ncbi:MAG: biotin--[acetyl-CoA-carboxylase] ligase [candidate division GAL15 bacterium]
MTELDAVQRDLRTRYVGRRLYWFEEVTSTNDVAHTLAEQGTPEGTVVAARTQTEGRGRLGRRWVSPPGGLWLSVVFRPPAAPHELPRLGLGMGVACSRALERACGVRVGLRWPNDLVVEGRKVGGILVESGPEGRWLVVGIGVNVSVPADQLPEGAASVEQVAPVDRAALLQALLVEVEMAYELFRGGDWATLLDWWRRRSTTLGRRVRVHVASGVYEGVAEDVDEDGALLLRLPDGRHKRIVAGDVG